MVLLPETETRYIFTSGGVLSGLGKGLCAASLGRLLKSRGYKVSSLKCENYHNIDAGTINPIEHGDPFLCDDGMEADMDLGTYERILDQYMGRKNFVTKGQIFKTIIDQERSMYYQGEDVEDIPHVVDEILKRIFEAGEGADFCLIEIGGTVGEYQNVLYYEAARHMRVNMPGKVINIHVSYVPVPQHLGEPKTKPTQMSVRTLMSMGINPEFLILRSSVDMDERRRYLLSNYVGVKAENIVMAIDLSNIYELPLRFKEQKLDEKILNHFNMPLNTSDTRDWEELIIHMNKKRLHTVKIAIAGKYFVKNKGDYVLSDAYHALIESLKHAGWHQDVKVDTRFLNTNQFDEDFKTQLAGVDGIIVPIGWGERGVEGKLYAIQYAREHKIPYVGLCYGMQLACVEYARNVLGLTSANTEEIDPESPDKVIHSIPFNKKYQVIKGEGVSMRLGAYDCVLKVNTLAYSVYDKHNAFKDKPNRIISERHRHRFEFNNEYRKIFEDHGFVFSGTSPDDFFVEYIELPRDVHPFFIATQAHPEYKSSPSNPHPLFVEFLKASLLVSKLKGLSFVQK